MNLEVNVRAAFWRSKAVVTEAVPFQVIVTSPEAVHISNLPFSSIHLVFSDDRSDLVLSTSDGTGDFADVGTIGKEDQEPRPSACLTWQEGRKLVIAGKLLRDVEGEVQVSDRSVHE